MKKSTQVPASLIITLAAAMTADGCGAGTYYECRDAFGTPMPDSYCRSGAPGAHWIMIQRGGFGGGGGGGGSFGG